ncbi:MAG: hypothetical protein QXH16_04175 [Candidatus Bathyarchaeia archaeon]
MEHYGHRYSNAERYAYEESYCDYHAVDEIVNSVTYQVQIYKSLGAHPIVNIRIITVHVSMIPVYEPLKQEEYGEAEGQM